MAGVSWLEDGLRPSERRLERCGLYWRRGCGVVMDERRRSHSCSDELGDARSGWHCSTRTEWRKWRWVTRALSEVHGPRGRGLTKPEAWRKLKTSRIGGVQGSAQGGGPGPESSDCCKDAGPEAAGDRRTRSVHSRGAATDGFVAVVPPGRVWEILTDVLKDLLDGSTEASRRQAQAARTTAWRLAGHERLEAGENALARIAAVGMEAEGSEAKADDAGYPQEEGGE
ncbi:uncharacterized protein BJ171DRAFT_183735 [Polychytrium aggregatum]|uniref:uncharacterized protein n=1 Tax=Polychytrium aggregatum TaxID=110093 RepID=UPI0022FF04AD|nr:uncharacterized protein BJ171DRAFT_183735 [Polychytrium aggregatum]KAI9202374.1 hypothetical protein BJ171DRAFT_183735 [Polychytrium aggregatum]